MSRRSRMSVVFTLLTLASLVCLAPHASAAEKAALPNPFYSYCVGIGVEKELASLESQLQLPAMHAELGYAGLAYVGLNGAETMLEALEKQGQKLFAVYSPLNIEPTGQGYDPKLVELIPKLKGHGTVVWLVVNSKTYKPSTTDGDERAVTLIREVADLAQQAGLLVSLYPHRGAYAERMEDVVRLAKKAQRPNVGVTFTYCHFLAVDDAKNLESVLTMARPYLQMVTINGTSGYDPKNRAGWILPLGEGSHDLSVVMKILRKLDYQGPVGIIAFGIKGDRREILTRSIKAWREIAAKAAASP